MMMRAFRADMLKMKRKWIWFLIFLGPIGVISLQGVNYGIRYDYLLELYSDNWEGLIGNVRSFIPITLLLGVAIITSMIANIEHNQHSWKQMLALPIRRSVVYSAKFSLTVLLLFSSCILLFVGTIALGVILNFGWDLPVVELLKMSFLPLLASTPVIAIQLWLTMMFENQALGLSIGILGAVFSMFALQMPDWLIWKWPLLEGEHAVEWYVSIGIITGLIIFIAGMMHFTRRDVK